jgi:hypothetical protein
VSDDDSNNEGEEGIVYPGSYTQRHMKQYDFLDNLVKHTTSNFIDVADEQESELLDGDAERRKERYAARMAEALTKTDTEDSKEDNIEDSSNIMSQVVALGTRSVFADGNFLVNDTDLELLHVLLGTVLEGDLLTLSATASQTAVEGLTTMAIKDVGRIVLTPAQLLEETFDFTCKEAREEPHLHEEDLEEDGESIEDKLALMGLEEDDEQDIMDHTMPIDM